MKINNRLVEYAAAIFFLLACLLIWFTPPPQQSDIPEQPSRFKLRAASTNQSSSTGHQIRKICLEITLLSNKY